MTEEKDLT